MSPASGRSRPPSRCSSVDLQLPERPSTATTSSASTASATPSSTHRRARPAPTDFLIPRASRTATSSPYRDKASHPPGPRSWPNLYRGHKRKNRAHGTHEQELGAGGDGVRGGDDVHRPDDRRHRDPKYPAPAVAVGDRLAVGHQRLFV